MPESWRSQLAEHKNRWLIAVVVAISLLFHAGLAVLFWKYAGLGESIEKGKPIFVEMVGDPNLQSQQGKQPPGRIAPKYAQLPSNRQRPNKNAKIITDRDNRTDKETHRRDVPINESSKTQGAKGVGGVKPGQPGKAGPKSPKKGSGGPGPSGSQKTASDLINSVGFKNLPKAGSGGGNDGGAGSLSPYNPDVGEAGDIVNINTRSFKYVSYFAGIKEKIEWAWVYPQQAQRSGQQGTLTMTFTILRSGRIKSVNLVRSSGYRLLDQAAMDAVRDAAPYGPMPASWDDEELTIMASFQYSLVGSKYVY